MKTVKLAAALTSLVLAGGAACGGGGGPTQVAQTPAPEAAAPATTAPATTAPAPATAAPPTAAPSAAAAEGPSPMDLAREPNVLGPPVAFTATGPEDKKLPDLALSIVGDADTLSLGVIESAKGSGKFNARLNACNESGTPSFGKIEWTITCGGQKFVQKVDNACDPCSGEAGGSSLTRKKAAACWKPGNTPSVAVKFTIDGVSYEATSPGPDLSKAGSTETITEKLAKAGVAGAGAFGEVCCPTYPAASERAGTLTLAGAAPVRLPFAVYRGTPERFPAGPICQHSGMPEATLSYGFPSHRYDVLLVDDEYAPLTGAAREKATSALDQAFKAAGGQRVSPGAP
jgi:hypothetical protein